MAAQIEDYLRRERRWVRAEELSREFGVRERAFRAFDGKPGLCTEFAISGDKGYRHVEHATEAEWDRFYARGRKHGIGELVRLRRLRRRRAGLISRCATPPATTRDGQCLLFSAS